MQNNWYTIKLYAEWLRLASLRFAALSSLLKLKEEDTTGDRVFVAQALEDSERLIHSF